MLTKLWLTPPLAFARLGASSRPMDSFTWGSNDQRPRGTGKTTLSPLDSLAFNDDGTLRIEAAGELRFKDQEGFRPVCPFFELHGEWTKHDGQSAGEGIITPDVLQRHGVTAASLTWTVTVANTKPFHLTLDPNDRIEAIVEIQGDDVAEKTLSGRGPRLAPNPLVPSDKQVPLGTVRLSKHSEAVPGFRLRFVAPAGRVYGPTNLPERLLAIPERERDDYAYQLPPGTLILNPNASWCRFNAEADVRTNPGFLYAYDNNGVSLGLVDDVSDGIVRCTLTVGDTQFTAAARVAVGPPDYAPDRRPFVSLADGLKDRVDRADQAVTDEQILDLFERAWETMGMLNVEVQNARVNLGENPAIAYNRGLPFRADRVLAFRPLPGTENDPLPLTARGRRRHQRLSSLTVLKNAFREDPTLIERIIRPPAGSDPFYTAQMPALMRGSDRYPMHLTRRQYDLLVRWVRQLREEDNQ